MTTLSLPLVSYRGLWDRFAPPGSRDAITRAFRRGVTSVAWLDWDSVTLDEVLALANDPAVNRRGVAVVLATDTLPPADTLSSDRAPVYAMQTAVRSDRPWRLFQLEAGAWVPCGCYVPVAATCAALSAADLAVPPGGIVLFESDNVIDAMVPRPRVVGADDAFSWTRLRSLLPRDAVLGRVSDLVELDQLELVSLEAA